MEKINWCLKKENSIKLIEPNLRIGLKYLKQAENDLIDLEKVSLRWQNIISYYSCYNIIQAILFKIGIKSEIHECSIEFLKFFDYFNKEDIFLIEKLKKNRIDSQYYLKEIDLTNKIQVFNFIIKAKIFFYELNSNEINAIRKKIQSLICQ